MPGQERDRDAERRHLGQRQVHEDDAAGEHVEAQVDVDAGEDEAGEEGEAEDVEHGARGCLARGRRGRGEPPHVEVEERQVVARLRIGPHRRGQGHRARAAPRRHLARRPTALD